MTREAIVATALESIRNHGLRGLALREVARRLAVSLPTIQHHFATRDELWRGCVDHLTAQRLPMLEALPSQVPGAGLAEILRAQLAQTTLAPGLTAAMWHDPEEGAEERLDYLEERARPLVELGRRRIQAGITNGTLRPVDPDVVTALIGLGMGSLANAPEAMRRLFGIDLDDEAARERLATALTDILLNGLLVERRQ